MCFVVGPTKSALCIVKCVCVCGSSLLLNIHEGIICGDVMGFSFQYSIEFDFLCIIVSMLLCSYVMNATYVWCICCKTFTPIHINYLNSCTVHADVY